MSEISTKTTGDKIPGDPDRCPGNSCRQCEFHSLCHAVVAPTNVDIEKIRKEIAERDISLHEASRDNNV